MKYAILILCLAFCSIAGADGLVQNGIFTETPSRDLCGRNVVVASVELKDASRLPLDASVVADTPQALRFTTPQNAVKAITVAVANRSKVSGVYRVVIEQASSNGAEGRFLKGFPGFPLTNMSFFKVLTTAGDASDVGSAPLVEMDESCTVTIPAGTAGVVRFEFDAADVLPRTYRGCLSVIRVDANEPSVHVPVSLEVLPRRLPDLPSGRLVVSAPIEDEPTFRLMTKLGVFETCLDPLSFPYGLDADGNMDLTSYPKALQDVEVPLVRYRKWADASGRPARWIVAGDCLKAFRGMYGLAGKPEEEKRLWPLWKKAIKWRMNNFGFSDADYSIDETAPKTRRIVKASDYVNRTLGVAFPNVRSALLLDEILALREAASERTKAASSAEVADVIVYGGTSAGIAAAVQVRRMGLSCTVIEPTQRIGGLTTGGLGSTDIGNKNAFGGLSRRFYRDVATHYADPNSWTRQKPEAYSNHGQSRTEAGEETMWTFEPSVALAILESWEKAEDLTVVRGERLDRSKDKVEVEGGGGQRRIVSLTTESGRVFRGKVFIDATYEGDLLAAAGVSYTVGREPNALYGETVNGIQRGMARGHQFAPGVSAYVKEGDPSSGLLPGLERDVSDPDGTGDRRMQAYCFRMCLTDDPENRIPFVKPDGYCERDYELLFRNFAALERTGKRLTMPWINSPMPNRKTDTNNRSGFSTDFIGQNWNYPEASYAERAEIERAHLRHQRGLMWTLANHPRVPETVRGEIARWGTCKDEFVGERGSGWQNQLYVREGRRMIGEYVMTEANCRGLRQSRRSIALAAYQMDSHHVRRYVDAEGYVRNEGDVQIHKDENGERFPPYPIDYGAITPKRGECTNLLVPVCLSASHMAFGSIRMEPVFFALGQAAGTSAALCVEKGCSVQDLKYAELRHRLLADGQRL